MPQSIFEITIDLSELRIFVSFRRYKPYALLINKMTGYTIQMTVPELIEALDKVAGK